MGLVAPARRWAPPWVLQHREQTKPHLRLAGTHPWAPNPQRRQRPQIPFLQHGPRLLIKSKDFLNNKKITKRGPGAHPAPQPPLGGTLRSRCAPSSKAACLPSFPSPPTAVALPTSSAPCTPRPLAHQCTLTSASKACGVRQRDRPPAARSWCSCGRALALAVQLLPPLGTTSPRALQSPPSHGPRGQSRAPTLPSQPPRQPWPRGFGCPR